MWRQLAGPVPRPCLDRGRRAGDGCPGSWRAFSRRSLSPVPSAIVASRGPSGSERHGRASRRARDVPGPDGERPRSVRSGTPRDPGRAHGRPRLFDHAGRGRTPDRQRRRQSAEHPGATGLAVDAHEPDDGPRNPPPARAPGFDRSGSPLPRRFPWHRSGRDVPAAEHARLRTGRRADAAATAAKVRFAKDFNVLAKRYGRSPWSPVGF